MLSSLYARVLRYVWQYWQLRPWMFGTLVVLRIVTSLVDVAVPFAAGHLIDTVATAEGRDLRSATHALALLLAIVLIFQVLRGTLDFVLIRFSSDAMARLVRDAFARVQRFSSDWHANTFAGATVRRLTRGMWAFDTFTDTMIFNFMPAMVVVAAISAVFLIRWPLLGLLISGEIIVYLCVSIGLSVAWVGPASSLAQRYDSRISANLADCFGANPVVKSFAAELREDQRFARLLQGWKARATHRLGPGSGDGLGAGGRADCHASNNAWHGTLALVSRIGQSRRRRKPRVHANANQRLFARHRPACPQCATGDP